MRERQLVMVKQKQQQQAAQCSVASPYVAGCLAAANQNSPTGNTRLRVWNKSWFILALYDVTTVKRNAKHVREFHVACERSRGPRKCVAGSSTRKMWPSRR